MRNVRNTCSTVDWKLHHVIPLWSQINGPQVLAWFWEVVENLLKHAPLWVFVTLCHSNLNCFWEQNVLAGTSKSPPSFLKLLTQILTSQHWFHHPLKMWDVQLKKWVEDRQKNRMKNTSETTTTEFGFAGLGYLEKIRKKKLQIMVYSMEKNKYHLKSHPRQTQP